MAEILDQSSYQALLERRATEPANFEKMAKSRSRRELVGPTGRLLIVALDHPGRGIVGVGKRPHAMADRRTILDRAIRALRRRGVDGLLATPDIVEDLLLLGELDDKVVIGSMNRGGLSGSRWELDDRFTAYDAESIAQRGLDGGKMLLRLDYDDQGTIETMEACAQAVTALAQRGLMAMVEPLPAYRDDEGALRISADPDRLVEAVSVASALGATSSHTWLKLPAVDQPDRMMAATSLPALLLGGDPGGDTADLFRAWREALAIPNVRGLVAGRSLLFPPDEDVERATDAAVELVHG